MRDCPLPIQILKALYWIEKPLKELFEQKVFIKVSSCDSKCRAGTAGTRTLNNKFEIFFDP